MTEISFAKQFLATLDSRPIKLSSDYVADPRQLPPQPAYILPRMPNPPTKRPRLSSTELSATSLHDQTTSTGNQPTVNITFHTLRPTGTTPTSVALQSQALGTSIYDLKAQIASSTGYTPDKIKLLWEKRPVADSRTLGDVLGAGGGGADVEMGIMFVGVPTSALVNVAQAKVGSGSEAAAIDSRDATLAGGDEPSGIQAAGHGAGGVPPVAQGVSGRAVVQMEEFWRDLHGFIVQRVRDEELGNSLVGVFREAWRVRAG